MSTEDEAVLASVIVHCEEPSHADRRYIVFRFDLVTADDRRVWVAGDNVRRLAGGRKAMAYLDGPRRLAHDERRRSLADIRARAEMVCGLCGLKGVYRYGSLTPVLDRLAEAGVSAVSLSGLAAIVSS